MRSATTTKPALKSPTINGSATIVRKLSAQPVHRWWRRPVLGLAAFLCLGLGLPTGVPGELTRFTVWDHAAQAPVYGRAIDIGATFQLTHTHSVTGRPVLETFSVQDPVTVAMEELVFDEFGPNLPAGAEYVGDHATFSRSGPVYRVQHHGHPLGSVPLMVGGPEVDHTVTFADGQRVRLLDVVAQHSRVELQVGPAP